jgi:hypothetical protein
LISENCSPQIPDFVKVVGDLVYARLIQELNLYTNRDLYDGL